MDDPLRQVRRRGARSFQFRWQYWEVKVSHWALLLVPAVAAIVLILIVARDVEASNSPGAGLMTGTPPVPTVSQPNAEPTTEPERRVSRDGAVTSLCVDDEFDQLGAGDDVLYNETDLLSVQLETRGEEFAIIWDTRSGFTSDVNQMEIRIESATDSSLVSYLELTYSGDRLLSDQAVEARVDDEGRLVALFSLNPVTTFGEGFIWSARLVAENNLKDSCGNNANFVYPR